MFATFRKNHVAQTILVLIPLIGLPSCESWNALGVKTAVSPNFDVSKITDVAVLVFDERQRGRQAAGALRDIESEFTNALIRKGYSVASRSDVALLMRELKLYGTDKHFAPNPREAGRFVNPPAILRVSLTMYGMTSAIKERTTSEGNVQRYRSYTGHAGINAQLLDLETSEVLWQGNYDGGWSSPEEANVVSVHIRAAEKVASTIPSRIPDPA